MATLDQSPQPIPASSCNRKSLSIAIALLYASIHSISWADTVYLKNGDRISGTIEKIAQNKLHIATDYSGTITIPQQAIRSFHSERAMILNPNRANGETTPMRAEKLVYDTDGNSNAIFAINHAERYALAFDEQLTIDENAAELALVNHNPVAYEHSGNVKLDLNFKNSSSKTRNFHLKGGYELTHNIWRHQIKGDVERKTDNGKTSTYRYNLDYSLDYFFNPYFFWQTTSHYQHDWVEDIKGNWLLGTGPGWQVWNDDRSQLALMTLLNYQQLEYRDDHKDRHPLMTFKWDYQKNLFANLPIKFTTQGSVGRSFNNHVTLDLNFDTAIQYKLTEHLSINTGYHFDRTKAKRGDSKNSNIFLGIGVDW
ncbi:hypothetical protein DC083_07220 [Ignatzschineria ureiclastica]|uniref:DUF481 domain-containing protein n=1 Tax=Ignatzschineria ureiclastica TaxID=472582 RepID=A0A2U2AEB0_9GAMM|nr:DUF481 domain-containing protein [Ignatzschineria ureiclastica]PWD80889.1 hypothetical protein DC083_07220 [Ignatzschineria ureiclastica]GGZ94101.1 hypothetical protein GCM10007162_07120 [Ignatzschineria ureiclastica]